MLFMKARAGEMLRCNAKPVACAEEMGRHPIGMWLTPDAAPCYDHRVAAVLKAQIVAVLKAQIVAGRQ